LFVQVCFEGKGVGKNEGKDVVVVFVHSINCAVSWSNDFGFVCLVGLFPIKCFGVYNNDS